MTAGFGHRASRTFWRQEGELHYVEEMKGPLSPALIRSAVINRQPDAVRRLVRALTPIVQCHVTRVLFRLRQMAAGRNVRQEIEDLTQEVFEKLLADGGRRLLAWSPEQGSAQAFFGVVTQRLVINCFESRTRNPWTELPVESTTLERASCDGDCALERLVFSRQVLSVLADRMLSGLSKRDQRLFELKYVHQADAETVQAELQIGRDAYYQASRRLKQRVRVIYRDLFEAELESLEAAGNKP